MYNILIVDYSIYRDSIVEIFKKVGHNVDFCESAYEAMKKLKAYDFDLIVSEVELPGDNAFDLYNYIQSDYPYIPIIMTTDKNIDTFFENIFKEGIGNIICKPLKKIELLNLSEKLITKKNIFGIKNYLKNPVDIKKIKITGSKQIQPAVNILLKEIENWGFVISNKMILNLVLNEMIINAVYHSHGLTEQKIKREQVKLKEGNFVDVKFARTNTDYGISITDYKGNLLKSKILDSINKVIEQDQILERAAETGENVVDLISQTGRGIDLVRKLSGEYYFIIKENVKTEIILLFSNQFLNDDSHAYSSLKIIEDFA